MPQPLAYPYGYVSAVGPREAAMAREAGYVSAVTAPRLIAFGAMPTIFMRCRVFR
jgi:hypothetical protein